MRRLVPVLIVATVLALGATVAADHPAAPIPAAAIAKRTPSSSKPEQILGVRQEHGKSMQILHASTKHETPRQKAHRIISATWPKSQVTNAMRVVKCETGGSFSQWALGDGGNSVSWFQIHLPSHPWVNRARARNNPWYATRAALRIWRESGWGAWTCARILGIA